MHLVRELVLILICSILGVWMPAWLGGPGPGVQFAVTAAIVVLPFQAFYGVALLAGGRAPAWLLGLLGAGAWVALVGPLWRGGGAAPAWPLWLAAVAPPALAALAGLRVAGGRRARAMAGALYGWAVTRWAGGAALLGLATGAPELNRQFLLAVGSLYLTLRVLAGIAWPIQGDRWFSQRDL